MHPQLPHEDLVADLLFGDDLHSGLALAVLHAFDRPGDDEEVGDDA